MKKPRKSYRPRPINPMAHLGAMMGAACMSRDDTLVRSMALRDAVEKASKGAATRDDWRLIFDCINLVDQLARMRVLQGLDVLEALQETVMQVMDRQRDTGTKALRAQELAALRDFAADYATVLRSVTRQQYAQAQRAVEDRIRRMLSSETIPESARVAVA